MKNTRLIKVIFLLFLFLALFVLGPGGSGKTGAGNCAALATGIRTAETEIHVYTTVDELNQDGDCSLREAVQAANTDAMVDACPAGLGSDTIILPAEVYTLTIDGRVEDLDAQGDPDVSGVLMIYGAGAIIQAGMDDP